MIAAVQKKNFKEEKVTEKFSIISNRISDYRLKPRDYAVYCCLVKHSDKNGVCFPSRRLIAEECCIDKKTVDAALRSLEKAGLVKSIRGASGGYVLARDASEISVGDVLRALEGNLEPVRCAAFYSEEGCMASDECVTKYVWQKINDSINKTVNEIKLDELVKESKELNPEGVIHGECSQQ